ncbi:MAG: GAF domain-containing protein [Actinomycetota bacterium]|nr:GAF domain-containing protein [Actinomycetota bacterium]
MPASDSRPAHFALRAWYAFRMLRLRSQVQPKDVPAVRSGDPLADRIVLVGNGPSHGWGVVSHQLALTGQLADAVATRTGRACDVDLIGAEAMNVRSALAWIGDRDLHADDGVVLVIGFNDALRFTPVATWKREMRLLLDGISSRLRREHAITVVGIPSIQSFSSYGSLAARMSDQHRLRLNAATRQIARIRGIAYLDLPSAPSGNGESAAAALYREFATRIATDMAPQLLTARPAPAPRAAKKDRVWDWSGTAAIVEAARHGGETDLRRLTEQAQKSFGVELAVVSLVDGDRLYHGTNTDVMPASVPLELSFCRYTVESGEPVIIPDTGRDERFAGNPLVDVSFINFYAGYPLRATDGHVIGSFCLQGSQPRKESTVALDLLRQLALEAQDVLRGYETAPPAVSFAPPMMAAPTGSPVYFAD